VLSATMQVKAHTAGAAAQGAIGSSETQFVQVWGSARTSATTLNGFGEPLWLYSSAYTYSDPPDSVCERNEVCPWGDYAAAAPDPKQSHVIWATNQVVKNPAGAPAPWATRIFAGRAAG
jgi:hypothetical protein